MRKILVALVAVFGLVAAVSAEPVYVGKKIEQEELVETFVSYDTDFDWSTVENVEEEVLADFYILQEDFDIHFEVGVTYTFYARNYVQKVSGVLTFQRLTEDTDDASGTWIWILTYTNE